MLDVCSDDWPFEASMYVCVYLTLYVTSSNTVHVIQVDLVLVTDAGEARALEGDGNSHFSLGPATSGSFFRLKEIPRFPACQNAQNLTLICIINWGNAVRQ